MADPSAIPPILSFPRSPSAATLRGASELVAAKVPGGGSTPGDRIELSAAAHRFEGREGKPLSPFRTPADRMEAATGVARGRLVDRLA